MKEKVGSWTIDEKLKSKIRFKLDKSSEKMVVYAFLLNSLYRYIGICDNYNTT